MNHDEQVEAKIAAKYKAQPWLGVCSVEEAIQSAILYRCGLSGEERRQYDEAILEGWHPERAMTAVEYASGRDATLQQHNPVPIRVAGR
jgi:hypothetical protein